MKQRIAKKLTTKQNQLELLIESSNWFDESELNDVLDMLKSLHSVHAKMAFLNDRTRQERHDQAVITNGYPVNSGYQIFSDLSAE